MVDLYDDTGGDGWTGQGAGCQRTDPCGSCDARKKNIYYGISCNAGGTTVTQMCVCSPRLAAPRRACELANWAVTDSTSFLPHPARSTAF
jgi:hypothetical protein